jgi:hypothetical protein
MLAMTDRTDYLSEIGHEVHSRCPWMVYGEVERNWPYVIDAVPAETVDRSEPDDCHEQWDCLHRRLVRLAGAGKPGVPVANLIQAYEEATGTWIGCD